MPSVASRPRLSSPPPPPPPPPPPLEPAASDRKLESSDSGQGSTPISELQAPSPTLTSSSPEVHPPALPPRPANLPPRPPTSSNERSGEELDEGRGQWACRPHPPHALVPAHQAHNPHDARRGVLKRPWLSRMLAKYVLFSLVCGLLLTLLGLSYVAVYVVLQRHTSSLHLLQTIPAYTPAFPLITAGLMVTSFARRANRNTYLMRVSGALCLVSTVLCVVTTVTTTVLHMNRIQKLRECLYQAESRVCTCYSGLVDPLTHSVSESYVFHDTSSCRVVHGVLYVCLRAIFGISVIGILLTIFVCMVVYQLQSHERKKSYWAQLESHCHYLNRHRGVASLMETQDASMATTLSTISNGGQSISMGCECDQVQDNGYYWSTRHLNVYSPNPVDSNRPELRTSVESDRVAASASATSDTATSHNSTLMRSFRNWLRGRSINRGPNGSSGSGSSVPPLLLRHNMPQSASSSSVWRRSFPPESTYGFVAPQVLSSSCSYPTHLAPVLPRYVFDPPPPYSMAGVENEGSNNRRQGISSVTEVIRRSAAIEASRPAIGEATATRGPIGQSRLQDKSAQTALPISDTPITRATPLITQATPQQGASGSAALFSSLPSRRGRRPDGGQQHLAPVDEEAVLVQEVQQRLNALIMLKYQRSLSADPLHPTHTTTSTTTSTTSTTSTTTTSVMESSSALDLNPSVWPLLESTLLEPRKTPMNNARLINLVPSLGVSAVMRTRGLGYGRNRNSTSSATSSVENKYESIEKSLSPYKIASNAIVSPSKLPPPTKPKPCVKENNVQVSIRKQLEQIGVKREEQQHSLSPLHLLHELSPDSKLTLNKLFQPLSDRLRLSNSIEALNNNSGVARSEERPTRSSAQYANLSPVRGQAISPMRLKLDGLNARSRFRSQGPSVGGLEATSDSGLSTRESSLMPECVYLRPEQNIPEVFGNTKFQPIERRHSDNNVNVAISRDDIVVTMRSAQV